MLDLIAVQAEAKLLHDLISRLQQPPFVITTTVINDNLFAVASKYYNGDLTAWETIAKFNGLVGSKIIAPTVLKLPPINGVLPTPSSPSASTVYEANLYPIPPAETA